MSEARALTVSLAAAAALAALAVLGAAPRAARAADPAAEAAAAYTLDTAGTTAEVKAGGQGKLVLAIRATNPAWHVHPEAPLTVRFQAPAALELARTEPLRRADAVDPKAAAPRFELPFVAATPGALEATAKVDFFICSDAACVKQTRTVSLPVTVK